LIVSASAAVTPSPGLQQSAGMRSSEWP
jgi:hypothetical protein